MTGKVEKKNQHLAGIRCIVNSCYYNSEGSYCNAAKIEIQPPNASNTQDTDCATFTHR